MPQRQGRNVPGSDVFARTVPLLIEKHYFGESRKASLAPVQFVGEDGTALPQEAQAKTKALSKLTKRLIDSPELRRVKYRDNEFRHFMNGVATLFRPGMYLVALPMVDQVNEAAITWERERAELVEAAAAVYPAHVRAMREPLGPLFNPLDYPKVDVFKSKFWVDWRFIDFGVSSVLKEVRADIFRRESEKLQRQANEARALIEQHLRSSLLGITSHLRDLLAPKGSGKRSNLRDDCLEKLMAFLETVDDRNVTGDEELSTVVRRLRTLGRTMDLEVLRDDNDVRDQVARDMAAITAQLDALVIEGPARGIRLRDHDEEEISA